MATVVRVLERLDRCKKENTGKKKIQGNRREKGKKIVL